MSARINDRALIARLLFLASSISSTPHAAADYLEDLVEIGTALRDALAERTSCIGWAEALTWECLHTLATKPLLTGASVYRLVYGASLFQDEIRDNYQAAERAALGAK